MRATDSPTVFQIHFNINFTLYLRSSETSVNFRFSDKNYVPNVCVRVCVWGGIAHSVERLAMGWTIRGSNPGGGEIFRTRPERPFGPPSLLYNGYQVFPGLRRPERVVDHPPPSSAEAEELYICSVFWPSWPVLG
jgi:hypothetical protein